MQQCAAGKLCSVFIALCGARQLPAVNSCTVQTVLCCCPFQADPHPGNLIRTPDGRLCILDFGLMCRIDNNIKFGMIEAVSHLIHRYSLILGLQRMCWTSESVQCACSTTLHICTLPFHHYTPLQVPDRCLL